MESSLMTILAVLTPASLGVKVTVIVQPVPAASEAEHVFITVKSLASVPVVVMLLIVCEMLSLFVMTAA